MQESTRPTNKKVKRGGQYCVAGLPNGESCTNSSLTPGISMHRFPSKNLDLRRQWIRFVRRHRANFNHQAYSIGPYLCSDHFERSCYEKPFALELPGFDSSKTKRTLKKDAIPTVFDTRGQSQAFSESSSKVARNRRTVSIKYTFELYLCTVSMKMTLIILRFKVFVIFSIKFFNKLYISFLKFTISSILVVERNQTARTHKQK